jgi:nicotinate dehydrogenase subunit B
VLSVDPKSVSHIPNVRVLQVGNFVGVVAPREYDAIQAAAQLKVTWAPMPPIPGVAGLWSQMRSQDSGGQTKLVPYSALGNVDSAVAGAAHTVTQTYAMHYNGHLPIGPSCAVAEVTPLLEHPGRVQLPRRDPGGACACRAEPACGEDPGLLHGGLERVRHVAV